LVTQICQRHRLYQIHWQGYEHLRHTLHHHLTVKYFQTGPPEEWLLLQRDLRRFLNDQNTTTGPAKYVMIRHLIMGVTLTVFDNAAQTHGNETNANFELCLRDVSTHIFPQNACTSEMVYAPLYEKSQGSGNARICSQSC
jgi:hypothetical protein